MRASTSSRYGLGQAAGLGGAGLPGVGRLSIRDDCAPRGGIPDDFVPTGVLRCRTETREIEGQGKVTMLITERADTDTGELLAELRWPSDLRSEGICDASYVEAPYVILVDPAGKALVPAVPTDSCGKPRPEVRNLVATLSYRIVSEVRQG